MTLLRSLARPSRRLAALAGVALVVSACQDPFEVTASTPNLDRSFSVWAMSGTPASYPSAVYVADASAARLDDDGVFDLAFDLDAEGRVMVLPVSRVVSPVSGSRLVEFQRASGPFNTVVEAPRSGWKADSLLLVAEGQTFLVKVAQSYCAFDIRQEIFGKFVVDSIIPDERRIRISARVNPNCGFRSLLSGVPEF